VGEEFHSHEKIRTFVQGVCGEEKSMVIRDVRLFIFLAEFGGKGEPSKRRGSGIAIIHLFDI
jgi:hypothetical protein